MTPTTTIADELHAAVTAQDPTGPLADLGRTERFCTDLEPLHDIQIMDSTSRGRHKATWDHTLQVAAKTPADRTALRYAALLHDVGKPPTRRFTADGVTFHGHEAVGERITRRLLTDLGHTTDFIDEVCLIVAMSGRAKTDTGRSPATVWTDSAIRRFARDAAAQLDDVLLLARADVTSKHQHNHDRVHAAIEGLEAAIARVAAADRRAAERPDLNGRDVMDILGIGPGPTVGAALTMLLHARRTHGPLDRAEATTRLRGWWATTNGDA